MSKLSDIAHAAKHLVVEDDSPAPVAKKPTLPLQGSGHPAFNLGSSSSSYAAAAPALAPGSPFTVPSTTVVDEHVYQSVLAKTNFDDTPVGKAVRKYYDALDGVVPDQTQRFKAAIGQAQKIDGITPEQVISTFDNLQSALEKDAQGFQTLADTVEKNQITSRQNKVGDLTTQVTQLNSQIAQLQIELTSETANHSNAVTQYGLAEQRRAQEIAQQKAQFSALLR